MSRFHVTTLLTVFAIIAAAVLHEGPVRWAVIAGLLGTNVAVFGLGLAFIRMQYFTRSICRGKPGKMRVALTFDDGPNPAATPALLDLLRQENIQAAFFCIGKNVAAHPALAQQIAAEGHLVENHSYHHSTKLLFVPTSVLVREFTMAQDAIQAATGVTPRFFRPPVGLTNPHFGPACRKIGLTIVGWDVRPLDTVREAADVIERVIRQAQDGSIIVLHDGGTSGERITEMVSGIVKGLRKRGYGFERLDRLIEG